MTEGRGLRSLTLVLTGGCNLACAYCYQNAKTARAMDWETARGGVELLLALGRPGAEVAFLGGEPLLEFPLLRRVVAYRDRQGARGRETSYAITTNGTLLDEEASRYLRDRDFLLRVSFDGVPPVQDRRGAGTFALLDRRLAALRRLDRDYFRRRVGVSVTLTPATAAHLADSVAYFLERRVGEIQLAPAMNHQPGWRREAIVRLDAQFARVFDLCLEHRRRTGETPLVLFRREKDASSTAREPDSALCGAPTGEGIVVDVDGRLLGCTTWTGFSQRIESPFLRERMAGLDLGRVGDPDVRERIRALPAKARATGLFFAQERKRSSYGECGECEHFDGCRVCPMSIGHAPGNGDPDRIPDFPCAFYRTALAWRDRFPAQPTARERLTGRSLGPHSVCARVAARRATATPAAPAAADPRG